MSERYHNIFAYYRGPNESDKALENNVTKALINALELSSPSVKEDFIKLLSKQIGVSLEPPRTSDFLLFPTRTDLPNRQVSVLLGIKPYWASEEVRGGRVKKGERHYDAALIGQNWLVAVESKLYDGMDPKQFKTEMDQLGPNAVRKEITWKQIYVLFRQLQIEPKSTSDLLRSHFCEYLKMIHQVGFEGFKKEYAGCVTNRGTWVKRSEHIRNELRGVMYTLAADLYEFEFADGETLKRLYPNWSNVKGLRKGNKTYDWAYLFFFPRGTRSTKWAYQCILFDLRHGTLDVKAEVSTQEALGKLRRKLDSDKDKSRLIGILQELRGKGVPAWFNLYHEHENGSESVCECQIQEKTTARVLEGAVGKLAKRLHDYTGRKNLKFELRKTFKKSQVIHTGSDLVKEIADTMRSLHPFVEFVNSR